MFLNTHTHRYVFYMYIIEASDQSDNESHTNCHLMNRLDDGENC